MTENSTQTNANNGSLITDFWMLLLGVVLILASIYLIFQASGVGINGLKPVTVAGVPVTVVLNSPIDPANNNKLIYTYGAPETSILLEDQLIGYKGHGVQLIRRVEMYQWTQTQASTKEKLDKSIDQETVVYTYQPIWSANLIDSDSFKDKVNYRNPLIMPLDAVKRKVQEVKVGSFRLSPELIELINTEEMIDLSSTDLAPFQSRSKSKVFHDGKYIFVGNNVDKPEIGDLRISLVSVAPSVISIIAQQSDATLRPLAMQNNTQIALVTSGQVPPSEMVTQRNSFVVGLFYVVSLVLMFLGMIIALKSISANSMFIQRMQQLIALLSIYGYALLLAAILWSFNMMVALYFTRLIFSLLFLGIFVLSVGVLVKYFKR